MLFIMLNKLTKQHISISAHLDVWFNVFTVVLGNVLIQVGNLACELPSFYI